jgi:hypothetical protein
MPGKTRFKTKYAGVFYIEAEGAQGPEKVYYIQYRRNGKLIEEKAGRQHQDDMTPARASGIRARRIDGEELPNAERRAAEKAARDAEAGRWTLTKLWESYKAQKPNSRSIVTDNSRFTKHLEPTLGKKEPHEIAALDVDRIRIMASKGHSPLIKPRGKIMINGPRTQKLSSLIGEEKNSPCFAVVCRRQSRSSHRWSRIGPLQAP